MNKLQSIWKILTALVLVLGVPIGACTDDDDDDDDDDATAGRSVGAETAISADAAAAARALAAYQRAIVERRGGDASALVTTGTIDHYERLRQLAVSAPADVLAAEPMVDRLAVVLLRTRFAVADIEASTGATVLAGAVDVGMIGQQVGTLVVGDATVDATGGRATVSAVDGAGRLVEVDMVREGAAWKIDLTALLTVADTGLRELAAAQGISEDELILAIVAAATGVTVGPGIFDPPTPAGG